jgi:2-polyprenyl-3-methyl-5-hydroxy-6-metoxy-1,4-benzoquinol methylase
MSPRLQQFIRTHDYPCWCGIETKRLVCKQMFGRRPFVVLKCMGCGTQRILPRALAEQSAAETLYNSYQEDIFSARDLQCFQKRALARLQAVEVTFRNSTTVLDVGCGSGDLLNSICSQFGCAGKGIDVDARRIGRAIKGSTGAEFECGLFDPKNVRQQFDVVISNAVIEHVIDPVKLLQDMAQALRPGGQLFILTPNAASLNYRILGSWWRELLSIGEHIYLFTPASLQLCAQRAGLSEGAMSSGFDFVAPRLSFTGLRQLLIGCWWCYRETAKRLSSLVAGSLDRDILYGRFEKPRPQPAS